MTRRTFSLTTWLAVTAAAVSFMPPAHSQTEPAKPAQIVVNASGGAQEAALKKSFYDEYEKRYGIKVVATSPADLGKLQAMVRSGNVQWHITELTIEEAIRAEAAGLLEAIDEKIVDRSRFPDSVKGRKYIFTRSAYSTVIGYRTDVWKAGAGPKDWKDFWDVAKFPGPRSLQNKAVDNLEFALLADGVAPDKLYPIDVDRAFKKLDQIKKNITVFWTTGAQSAQLLVDKEVVLGTAWNGRYYSVIEKGAPIHIEWNQGSIKESAFVIPKGAKDLFWANRMLSVMTDAKLQATYANIVTYPGLNLDSVAHVDPKIAPHLPTHSANLSKQFWQDAKWWADNGAAVEERWAKWVIAK